MIDKLQELINKKARDRAFNEVEKFTQDIRSNKNILELLKEVNCKIKGATEDIFDKSLFSGVYYDDNKFKKFFIDKLTDIYIPEETEKFIKKVNSLSDEIEKLKENYE